MCLHSLFKEKPQYGYKVFKKEDGVYKPCYQSNEEYVLKKEYTSNQVPLNCDWTSDTYSSGFHIFEHKTAAKRLRNLKMDKRYVVCKVQYRVVLTRGLNMSGYADKTNYKILSKCVVAAHMTILEEV